MKLAAMRGFDDRDMSADGSVVRIGSRVRVRYADADDEDQFVLVSAETDRTPHGLSADSPLGRALLDMRAAERVKFQAPGGVYDVTVLSVYRDTEEALSS